MVDRSSFKWGSLIILFMFGAKERELGIYLGLSSALKQMVQFLSI